MSLIQSNLEDVRNRIIVAAQKSNRDPSSIRLIAVTKTHPAQSAQEVIDAGCFDIGENRVQEILTKVPELTGDFSVHLIGQLQTNKIAKVVPLVNWIHSVDRMDLLVKLDETCSKLGKRMNILVQVNTSNEEAKSGCEIFEVDELCAVAHGSKMLDLRGLMTIGPLGATDEENRKCFALLRELAEENRPFFMDDSFELSMGMSGDFEVAIEEGATMVRVGSGIFGAREVVVVTE